MAVNNPEEGSIVPVAVADELHVPPPVLLLRLVVKPEHATVVPLIADGNAFTVNVLVALHPVAKA